MHVKGRGGEGRGGGGRKKGHAWEGEGEGGCEQMKFKKMVSCTHYILVCVS